MKTILVKNTRDPLYGFSPQELRSYVKSVLENRAMAAFFFGSFARDELRPDSDVDLLIAAEKDLHFPARGRLFESLTTDPSPGFWNSVVKEMVRVL